MAMIMSIMVNIFLHVAVGDFVDLFTFSIFFISSSISCYRSFPEHLQMVHLKIYLYRSEHTLLFTVSSFVVLMLNRYDIMALLYLFLCFYHLLPFCWLSVHGMAWLSFYHFCSVYRYVH